MKRLRRIVLIIVSLGGSNFLNGDSIERLIREDFGVAPERFSEAVFQRFYAIKRLKSFIKQTKYREDSWYISNTSARNTIETLSIPLQYVWSKFSLYKHLFNTVVFDPKLNTYVMQYDCVQTGDYGIQKEGFNRCNNFQLEDVDLACSSGKIFYRFYYIQRLNKSLILLQKLQKLGYIDFSCCEKIRFFSSYTTSETALLHYSILDVVYARSVDPLLIFWLFVKEYYGINDYMVVQQFSITLTTLIFSSLKKYRKQLGIKGFFLEECEEKIQKIDNLSVEEMLLILDLFLEEIPPFVEKIEIISDLSWSEWVKKYWLIAPLTAACLVLKMYISFKKNTLVFAPADLPISAPKKEKTDVV